MGCDEKGGGEEWRVEEGGESRAIWGEEEGEKRGERGE